MWGIFEPPYNEVPIMGYTANGNIYVYQYTDYGHGYCN